ncbi:unnamed protein product [Lasius platythorax]|uniref:Uncharacterized protein n=1 Tax=Lasius platythorax TaxID=488582 RepID=A0AAV2P1P3_9HYME
MIRTIPLCQSTKCQNWIDWINFDERKLSIRSPVFIEEFETVRRSGSRKFTIQRVVEILISNFAVGGARRFQRMAIYRPTSHGK